jgi:hypothetical protein
VISSTNYGEYYIHTFLRNLRQSYWILPVWDRLTTYKYSELYASSRRTTLAVGVILDFSCVYSFLFHSKYKKGKYYLTQVPVFNCTHRNPDSNHYYCC